MSYSLAELSRRFALMIRVGQVSAVDAADPRAPRCMVAMGSLETDWLPWFSPRAGNDSEFWAPEIGEQAVVFSPFGEQAQGFVLFGIAQDAMPMPETNPERHVRKYKDGALVSYDRAAHAYLISVPSGGNITLQVGSTSLILQDGKATLTAQQFEHVGDQATFDGQAIVKKLLSWLSGVAGNAGTEGGTNTIQGGVKVANGDVDADGITLKGHHHIEHDGPPTSNAKP
ncbi:phage baseplate assembly protein V [Burkholderia alba]|uniref:phage baseplate assembly protein V n=1 Tax=Burkholderia alba TaxID=2683677 RepID=UPI002B05576D|nr:phage baseplate assembly protein V [Burkholderia alba]